VDSPAAQQEDRRAPGLDRTPFDERVGAPDLEEGEVAEPAPDVVPGGAEETDDRRRAHRGEWLPERVRDDRGVPATQDAKGAFSSAETNE
jgi:hypothetical protein